VIPPPRIQCSLPTTDGESQESQDEYGALELDLDDPELLAALGDSPTSPEAIEIKGKDARVAQVSDEKDPVVTVLSDEGRRWTNTSFFRSIV
jgi:hypothetical protein